MRVIYRYKTAKPEKGHFSFMLHENAQILVYTEHWNSERGWELFMDALEDTSGPKELRSFFLCNAGDNLDFLGEHPDLYFVGSHEAKSYCSFVFETTHLSETEREQGKVQPGRFTRGTPHPGDLSYRERTMLERRRRDEQRARTNGATHVTPPAPPAPVEPAAPPEQAPEPVDVP